MESHLRTSHIAAPFGLISVLHRGMALHHISLEPGTRSPRSEGDARVIDQFQAYLDNADHRFAFTRAVQGSPHQTRVWKALSQIPVGVTRTYGELARQVGSGPRAIAQACRSNPLPLVIPCHRAVSANGIGGFMGTTTGPAIGIKHWLLSHERG